MQNPIYDMSNYDSEMQRIENAIVGYNLEVESLVRERYELIANKEELEMQEVFDCAIERGITPKEMMELVNSFQKTKPHKGVRQ